MALRRRTLLSAGLLLAASACQPAPRPDREPIHPTPVGRASTATPGASERSIELTEGGPVRVAPGERLPAAGDGVLIGAWPSAGASIDLDEHNAPVRELLQRFARVSRLNFVMHDGVRGQVTVALSGVAWPQALRAVLRVKDLVAVREGNVVRVLPRAELERERRAAR